MTERPQQNAELTEKESDVMNNDDSNAQMTEEKIQQGLTAVKSVIRENPQTGLEEDDTLGALKGPKMSGHKLTKFAKYKRSKGRTNERTDSDVSIDNKMENADPGNLLEKVQPEENAPISEDNAKSKGSLLQAKISSMSNKSLNRTDDDKEMDSSTAPERKKSMNEEIRTLISQEKEAPKEDNLNVPANAPQSEVDNSTVRSAVSQRSVHERGNYMNNVTPAYIEEYPVRDDTNDKRTGKK